MSVKCEFCVNYIPLKDWKNHIFEFHSEQITSGNVDISFHATTHKEVLIHLASHSFEIEEGLSIKFIELPFFRGRIDLVGIDKERRKVLIEVVHRSKLSHEKWEKKLKNNRTHLLDVLKFFGGEPPTIRLLVFYPNKPENRLVEVP